MTPETIILAIPAGLLIAAIAGACIMICRYRMQRAEPPDPQSEMYAAFQKYCDALDEAALDGDTKRYDRIRAMGWRNFSGELG